jgi:Signal transduction histidine kinase
MQTSQFEIELSETSVSKVVDKALSATKAAASKTKVAIESDITNDAFYADEDRIVQVLINLISNAVKYSQAGSQVLVKAGLEGAGLKFRVIDKGPGIPKQQHAVIFERYRQLAQPKGIKRRGFGLGLAICKALVEAHKGTIGVESEEGKGSTFWFLFHYWNQAMNPISFTQNRC